MTDATRKLLAACRRIDGDLARYAVTHGPGPDRRLADFREALEAVEAEARFAETRATMAARDAERQARDAGEPTAEEAAALATFAVEYGRKWKSYLRRAWETGWYNTAADVAALQSLRNRLGPSWLTKYKPPREVN
jgi:hypothetical protein